MTDIDEPNPLEERPIGWPLCYILDDTALSTEANFATDRIIEGIACFENVELLVFVLRLLNVLSNTSRMLIHDYFQKFWTVLLMFWHDFLYIVNFVFKDAVMFEANVLCLGDIKNFSDYLSKVTTDFTHKSINQDSW